MKHALAIFMITLTGYILTAGGHLYSPDEEILFRVTESIATLKGPAIEPIDSTGFGTMPGKPQRTDGREYAQYGIGQPLAAVPFYWLGQRLGSTGSDESWQKLYGWRSRLQAWEIAPRWTCSWFNILVGALMAVTVWLICLEFTRDESASFMAALLYALGSLAWPHSRTFFTEPLATLMIALSFLCILKSFHQYTTRWLVTAGLFAGYAVLVRVDSLFAYPAMAVLLAGPVRLYANEKNRPFLKDWIAFSLPVMLTALFLVWQNFDHFGHPFKSGYGDQREGIQFSTPLIVGLYGFLFSAGKGIFFFSPALILGCAGWRLLPLLEIKYRTWIITSLVCMVVIPLLIHSKWINWAGGWCWGPRHIFIIHLFMAVPIAVWIRQSRGSLVRVACSIGLITGMAVQLFGSSVDFIEFYRQQFRMPPDQNPDTFLIRYDDYDLAYWSQYYELFYSPYPMKPDISRAPNPLAGKVPLHLPSPTQFSLYHPRYSVWTGYPIMWAKGMVDNFWLNLVSDESH
jgi:hypothetical protein